jgi:hypothetical protein
MVSARALAPLCVAILLAVSVAPRAQSITPTLSYSVSGTTVTLNWTPAAGATSYELVVVSVANPIQVGNVLTVSTTVPPGFYQVQVRGRAGAVVGPLSNQVTIPVAVSTPAPTNLRAIQSGNGALLLWDLSSAVGVSAMGLQALSGPGGGVAQEIPVPIGTSLSVPSVPSGTYTVRLIGSGPAGRSAPSNEITLGVPGCTAAASIPLAIDTSGLVTVRWPGVPGATGYHLDVASTPGGPLIASIPLAPAQTVVTASPGIGTYYVTLRAPLGCGTTARSVEHALVVTQVSPVYWTSEQWRVWFFNLVASKGLPNATLSAMQATRADLVAMGADWQNGWRGDLRARIYLPVLNCPPPSNPSSPACAYSKAVDVGENGLGARWSWVPRF